ncbi:LPXTG cell wall anchor domain-containing protein [Kitasatospora sp. LaBMicrA B282]|uniref:LPXTG cell wall anchor domain-containing protein n=1 Tax=Kitasatospora sp. LaBMicrA B282 TaxID=3420949 RepID=UPI003D0E0603
MARQGRSTGRTLVAAAALAVLGSAALTGSAWANIPSITATCSTVTVDLIKYDASAQNTVTVKINGETVVNLQPFGDSYHKDFPVAAHTAAEVAELVVYTSADPKGSGGGTGSWTATIPVCPTPSPSPSTVSPSPSPSPTTAAPAPSPSPTTAAPSPSPSRTSARPTPRPTTPAPRPSSTSPALAFTGGGSSAGPIAAAGAGVVVLGGGLLYLTRRRRAHRH